MYMLQKNSSFSPDEAVEYLECVTWTVHDVASFSLIATLAAQLHMTYRLNMCHSPCTVQCIS